MPRLFTLALSVASLYLWLLMRSLMRAARITAPHHGTGVNSICVHAPLTVPILVRLFNGGAYFHLRES